MFRAGLCAWLNFPQSPQATQGKHNIAECPGLTCSKLPALRAEKKTNLALGMSRVAYGPGCPGVSQGIQRHPRVIQGSLATKAIFLMNLGSHWNNSYWDTFFPFAKITLLSCSFCVFSRSNGLSDHQWTAWIPCGFHVDSV